MGFEYLIQHYPIGETIVGDYSSEPALDNHPCSYTLDDIHDLFTNPPKDGIFCLEHDNNRWIVHFFWYSPIIGYMILKDQCGLVIADYEDSGKCLFIDPDNLDHDLLLLRSQQDQVFNHLDPETTFYTWEEFNTYYQNNG